MFFEVLSVINDPNRQASIEQLSQVQASVQKLAKSQDLETDQMQSMMTALGGSLRTILQQQQSQLSTGNSLTSILDQLTDTDTDTDTTAALESLIPPQLQQQMAQVVAQKTGMNADTIQSLLPQLLPVVMELLNMGASKPGSSDGDTNPLVAAFLDSDRDGDADLGNVMKLVDRFLNGPS